MKYPDDFDVPTFPAGKPTAVSRVLSIAVMAGFVLIIIMCSIVLWTQKSIKIHPFLVSVDEITGDWRVVGHHHTEVQELSTVRTIQESVIGNFMRNWFLISDNPDLNAAIWRDCNRNTDCSGINKSGINSRECALYCLAGDEIYTRFTEHIVPQYQMRIANGEMWVLDMASLQISPIDEINADGNVWQIRAKIYSNQFARPIDILAYAKLARNDTVYRTTMGYYIQDFNAYRIDK